MRSYRARLLKQPGASSLGDFPCGCRPASGEDRDARDKRSLLIRWTAQVTATAETRISTRTGADLSAASEVDQDGQSGTSRSEHAEGRVASGHAPKAM